MQGLTSGFPIMFHWIMRLFLTNIILFDCYSFVVQVEIRKYGTSNFVLLSQNYLGYLGSYNTYLALTNLGIFFSVSVKIVFWIYIGVALNLQRTLGSEGF